MQPKILFTGQRNNGSWQCRGEQLGGQLGTSRLRASKADCDGADLIVVVKRINHSFFTNVVNSGKPWVWDLVDFYPQPDCGRWNRREAIDWVRGKLRAAKPRGIVYPNKQMRDDVGIDGAVIYHHTRAGEVNPIREQIKVVGYEGSPRFLGRWRRALEKVCQVRGWQFAEDIPLADMDVVVAFRDGIHNGYVQQNWKSNVKLANAHGSGTPFIGSREAGYLETRSGAEVWLNQPGQLGHTLDLLRPAEYRRAIQRVFLQHHFTLESRAQQLQAYLYECL